MAAQKEKDRQIEIVLEKILEELKKFRRMTTVKTRNLPDLLFEAAASSSSASLTPVETLEDADLPTQDGRVGNRKRKHSPEAIPVDPISDLYAVLEGSALVPFLESRLQSSSFLEICRHATVFKLIIGILREMSEQSCLVSLLGPLPDQQTSLHSLLQNLESQARIVNDKIGKASANGSVPCKDKSEVNVEPEPNKKSGSKVKSGQCDDGQGLIIARDFLSLSMQVTEALKSTGYLPDINGITGTWTLWNWWRRREFDGGWSQVCQCHGSSPVRQHGVCECRPRLHVRIQRSCKTIQSNHFQNCPRSILCCCFLL